MAVDWIDIRNKADIIATRLGVRSNKDDSIVYRYKIEDLEIISSVTGNYIIVKICGKRVLYGPFDGVVFNYNDDVEWTSVIELIYNSLDSLEEVKKRQDEENRRNARTLNDLQEYFDFLLKCREQASDLYTQMLSTLKSKGVIVTEVCSGSDEYYVVKCDDNEVMEFRRQALPNPYSTKGYQFDPNSEYVAAFKPGDWVNTFKDVINAVRPEKEGRDKQVIGAAVEKIKKMLEKRQ